MDANKNSYFLTSFSILSTSFKQLIPNNSEIDFPTCFMLL